MKKITDKDEILLDVVIEIGNYRSNSAARFALKEGRVKVNGKIEKVAKRELKSEDLVEIIPAKIQAEKKKKEKLKQLPFTVLYEDKDIIAVDKPAGLLSVPLEKKRAKNMLGLADKYIRALSGEMQKAFMVHRPDKFQSGIMIIAKNHDSQQRLIKEWKSFTKKYYALVENGVKVKEATIKSKLKENRIGLVYSDPKSSFAKPAETQYRVINSNKSFTLLKVELLLEFKNQMRAQFSEMGNPIVGDKLYEAKTDPLDRIAIHLFSVTLNHPANGKELILKTPVPYNFNALIKGRNIKIDK